MSASLLPSFENASTSTTAARPVLWPIMLLVALLVLGTVLPSWYVNEHILTQRTYEHLLSGTLGKSAADSYSSTVHALSIAGYVGSLVLLGLRLLGLGLLVQLALLGFGQDVPFRGVARAVGWASGATVLRGMAHAVALSTLPPLSITARDLMMTPFSVASLTMRGSAPLAVFALYDAINPFEALWCAALVVLLMRYGVRLRVAAGAVIAVWAGLLAVQMAGYAYLSHLHL